MLELDLILSRFVKHELENLDEKQLSIFEKLLNQQDPDLYAWFMGYEQPIDKDIREIIAYMRSRNHH